MVNGIIHNNNEFSLFELPARGRRSGVANLRARALSLVRLEDQGARGSGSFGRQIPHLLSGLPQEHDNSEHPQLDKPLRREAALCQHGEFVVE